MESLVNSCREINIIERAKTLSQNIMLNSSLSANELSGMICICDELLEGDANTLAAIEVSELILTLLSISENMELPVLYSMRIKELHMRIIRKMNEGGARTCSPVYNSNNTVPYSQNGNREDGDVEIFTPTDDDPFELPPEGETTNLIVTEPNSFTGKTLIRNILIDHKGRNVKELSRRYTDIYTDESEEIYNRAYLDELNKLKTDMGKDNTQATDTRIEAEKNCSEE